MENRRENEYDDVDGDWFLRDAYICIIRTKSSKLLYGRLSQILKLDLVWEEWKSYC